MLNPQPAGSTNRVLVVDDDSHVIGDFLRCLGDYRGEARDLLFLVLGQEVEPLAALSAATLAALPLRARQELRIFNGVQADLLSEGPDGSAAVYLFGLLSASKQGEGKQGTGNQGTGKQGVGKLDKRFPTPLR